MYRFRTFRYRLPIPIYTRLRLVNKVKTCYTTAIMRRSIFFIVQLLFFWLSLFSQNTEAEVLNFRKNFARANLDTKYELIKLASQNADKTSSVFFLSALQYVDTVYPLLGNDATLMQLASISVESLARIKEEKALLPIRLLFIRVKDDGFQETCVKAFESYAVRDDNLLHDLNCAYQELFDKDDARHNSLVLSYISCLGKIGNEESFSLLFSSILQTKNDVIQKAAKTALSKINVNFFDEIMNIFEKKDVYSLWVAFEIACESSTITEQDLSTICEMALSLALDRPDENPYSKELIQNALKLLTQKRWQNATDLLVKYFYRVQNDFISDSANASDLIPIINCMAVLSSKDCADALTVFLSLLNEACEKGKAYNDEVTLATITALGALGDSNAFDYLLYVEYLNYSEKIKKAARDSIARLQW